MILASKSFAPSRVRGPACVVAALLVATAACGPTFDDCQSHRTCAPPPSQGEGGEGGAPSDAGGATGFSCGSRSPGSEAPCAEEGATKCASAADPFVWTCTSGTWVTQACAEGERCDSREPACRPIAEGCELRQPGEAFCDGERLGVCGPDLVTRDDERCSGLCFDGECRLPECGDGIVQEGEACDDGNDDDTDVCARCELARCGDGFTWDDVEQCDDGNERDDDACVGNCQDARCGDGFLFATAEECDHGPLNSDAGQCLTSCRTALCGDGLIFEDEEECDDANDVATDGCRSCAFGPTKLAAGGDFSCAIFGDGSLKCWGSNSNGQLGLGDTKNRGDRAGQLGQALPALTLKGAVSDVALGLDHACAIGGGSVYCWGGGARGQLGQGDVAAKSRPSAVEIGNGRPAALALGQWFSCVRFESGAVRCWGRGERGALGTGEDFQVGDGGNEMGAKLRPVVFSHVTGSTSTHARTISARRHRACAILDTGGVACWGDGMLLPEQPSVPLSPAAELVVGSGHRCLLNDRERVECWGDGSDGQLGSENTLDGVATVLLPGGGTAQSLSTGDGFTCAVASRKAYCWGKAGPSLGRPEHATEGNDLGDEAGEISTMASIDLGQDVEVHSLAAGFDHVCALLTTGDVKCWGANGAGQLGLGDVEARGDESGEMGEGLPVVPLR